MVLSPDPELKIVYSSNTETYPQDAIIHIAKDIPDAFERGLERVLVNASLNTVMILSHSCDIGHRDFVAVAPIFLLSSVLNADRRRSIRNYQVNYRFYLPHHTISIDDSYVDFAIINTVMNSSIDATKRILSLDEQGRALLIHGLYIYFCRPIIPKFL